MHNAAFAALGLDWAYVPLPVPPEHVGDAVRGLVALGFAGANVTVPHKQAVMPYLDELTPMRGRWAQSTPSSSGPTARCSGDSTDGAGFMADLRAHGVLVGEGQRIGAEKRMMPEDRIHRVTASPCSHVPVSPRPGPRRGRDAGAVAVCAG